MTRLRAIRTVREEKHSRQSILEGVWQTIQQTPVCKCFSLEPPRCCVSHTVRTSFECDDFANDQTFVMVQYKVHHDGASFCDEG